MLEVSRPHAVPIAQNQVPYVTDICDKLGFESLTDRHILQASAHKWRRTYKCFDGTLGKDLIDWKSPSIQRRLELMARDYLNEAENGRKFWQAKARSGPRGGLEWPKDGDKITPLMQQLFWRQNFNESRNAKNPARQHSVGDRSVSSPDAGAIVFTTPWNAKSSSGKTSLAHRTQQERALQAPASSSGPPASTSKASSRLNISNNRTQDDADSELRTLEEVMADTAETETVIGDVDPPPKNKDGSSEVYNVCGSDDDVVMGPVRTRSPKTQAPVAKMVADLSAARDPNFAFDAEPSIEAQKGEKPQKQIKTPKKRKRVRRIGSRVGSEDDDKTYTPRSTKRKRPTTPNSGASTVNPGSNWPVDEGASSTEKRNLRDVDGTRRRQSIYDSANLMQRFQDSRQQPLKSPNIPTPSQDFPASASQSQRSVDVVQQYPAISEHMHSFPAAPQIAQMSPTKSTKESASSTSIHTRRESPRQPSAQDENEEAQLRLSGENQATNAAPARNEATPAQTAELPRLPKSNVMSPSKRTPVDAPLPSRLPDRVEQSRIESDSPFNDTATEIQHSVEPTRTSIYPVSNTEQVSTAHDHNTANTVPPINTHNQVIEGAPNGQVISKESTTHVEQPAKTAQTISKPPSDITDRSPAAITSISPTPTPAPAATTTKALPGTPKSSLRIRYWIISSRTPELNRIRWDTDGLQGKSTEWLCTEIATRIGRPVLHSISINLRTSEGNIRYDINRNKSDGKDTFEELQEEFREQIKRDKKRGNVRFEITLEPDPAVVRSDAGLGLAVEGDEGEDSDVAF